jgi:predicted murein hydrolase (TIGR00659 family)
MSTTLTLIDLSEIWVYLSGSPLFSLFLTLSAYQLGLSLYQRTNKNPFANPVAIAVTVVVGVIAGIDMPYATYFEGAQFVHFLLGTATVALAVPIYKGWHLMRGRVLAMGVALVLGGLTSIVGAVIMAQFMGVPTELIAPLYAKSVTAPIGMGVAQSIQASPTLTAVYAVVTGITGSIVAPYVLNALSIRGWWQRGFAIGVSAHGIGTSRAFSVHPEAGAFSSMGMGINGVLGALFIPSLFQWISPWLLR